MGTTPGCSKVRVFYPSPRVAFGAPCGTFPLPWANPLPPIPRLLKEPIPSPLGLLPKLIPPPLRLFSVSFAVNSFQVRTLFSPILGRTFCLCIKEIRSTFPPFPLIFFGHQSGPGLARASGAPPFEGSRLYPCFRLFFRYFNVTPFPPDASASIFSPPSAPYLTFGIFYE